MPTFTAYPFGWCSTLAHICDRILQACLCIGVQAKEIGPGTTGPFEKNATKTEPKCQASRKGGPGQPIVPNRPGG